MGCALMGAVWVVLVVAVAFLPTADSGPTNDDSGEGEPAGAGIDFGEPMIGFSTEIDFRTSVRDALRGPGGFLICESLGDRDGRAAASFALDLTGLSRGSLTDRELVRAGDIIAAECDLIIR